MSKQSEAKEAQGYTKKPASCGNCVNFKSELVKFPPLPGWSMGYTEEKNRRCGIGGFAVGRNGHCSLWTRAAESSSAIEGTAA